MKKRNVLLFASTLWILFGMLYIGREQYQQGIQASIAGKVIRFHVLANSDNKEDQRIKLAVRDEVGAYMEVLLEDSTGIEDSRKRIKEHLLEITKLTNETLKKEGASYRGIASLSYSDFPKKEYAGFVFPEGRYEALKIILGKGEGHNWWCVMYPNLCFSSCVYQTNQKEWKRFKESLTAKEYRRIMEEGNYTIRLKFLEYFKRKG